jgi:hypothetical protein
MVRARFAGWESEPLTPVAIIVEFPIEAFMAAENKRGVLDPAETLNGLMGFEMTPVGKPVRVTWTESVKPLSGLMDNVIAGLVAPCWRLTEFEENAREKSGCGGAGGGGGAVRMLEEPPPQPMDAKRKRMINKSGAYRLSRAIEKTPRSLRVMG